MTVQRNSYFTQTEQFLGMCADVTVGEKVVSMIRNIREVNQQMEECTDISDEEGDSVTDVDEYLLNYTYEEESSEGGDGNENASCSLYEKIGDTQTKVASKKLSFHH